MTRADLIRQHYDASDRGDIDGMIAALGPDVRWTEAAGVTHVWYLADSRVIAFEQSPDTELVNRALRD